MLTKIAKAIIIVGIIGCVAVTEYLIFTDAKELTTITSKIMANFCCLICVGIVALLINGFNGFDE